MRWLGHLRAASPWLLGSIVSIATPTACSVDVPLGRDVESKDVESECDAGDAQCQVDCRQEAELVCQGGSVSNACVCFVGCIAAVCRLCTEEVCNAAEICERVQCFEPSSCDGGECFGERGEGTGFPAVGWQEPGAR